MFIDNCHDRSKRNYLGLHSQMATMENQVTNVRFVSGTYDIHENPITDYGIIITTNNDEYVFRQDDAHMMKSMIGYTEEESDKISDIEFMYFENDGKHEYLSSLSLEKREIFQKLFKNSLELYKNELREGIKQGLTDSELQPYQVSRERFESIISYNENQIEGRKRYLEIQQNEIDERLKKYGL